MKKLAQGDILSIKNIPMPVLVLSKDFFNQNEQIIAAPIVRTAEDDPLHIPISTEEMQGIVLCEQLKLLDLRVRGHKKVSHLKLEEIMDITDAVQSIFDYYPY